MNTKSVGIDLFYLLIKWEIKAANLILRNMFYYPLIFAICWLDSFILRIILIFNEKYAYTILMGAIDTGLNDF